MKPEALVSRLLALCLVLGGLAVLVYDVTAPTLLLLDAAEAQAARWSSWVVAASTAAAVLVLSRARLSRARYVVRAVAVGSRAFEPEEIVELGELPGFVTRLTIGAATLLTTLSLLPPVRPSRIDLATQVSLVLFALVVLAASALPLYVLARNAVAIVLELVPPDKVREALLVLERNGSPLARTRGSLIAAIVVPLSFVALAVGLVTNAHVRDAETRLRVDLAIGLARGASDVLPGALPDSGLRDALTVADDEGFAIRIRPSGVRYAADREPGGRIAVTVPLTDGSAVIRFDALDRSTVSVVVLGVGFAVIAGALFVAMRLGQTLATDLERAARRMLTLGSDDARAGQVAVAARARFEVVQSLGRAVDDVAARFRTFTRAQERAIDAREATLRLRGLLFASVSHDLKSPLNAILGFSALVAEEPLSEGQAESIAVVERRAKELLALIETILDAARVEAQKLQLHPVLQDLEPILHAAVTKGDELGPMDAATVELDIEPGLPQVRWDEARIAQALAALVGHAKRLAPRGGVKLSARRRDERRIAVFVSDPSRRIPLAEVSRLLGRDDVAAAEVRMGGLALGLSLSRALIELHGGKLTVERGVEGETLFRAVLPTVVSAPEPRPRSLVS